MVKIGFVFLDGIYLIPHFLSSAAELYNDPNVKVEILTNETENTYLFESLEAFGLPKTVVKKLPTYLYKKIAYKIQGRKKPSNQYIIKKNLKKLLDYDILVFTVFNNKRIQRVAKDKPKYVFLMHGAGDSPFPFQPEHKNVIEEFSLVTTPGKKVADLFKKMGNFKDTKFEICGYQKLDFVRKMRKEKKLFDNNKPIVLYNPHFVKELSSYFRFGIDILEYFYQQKDFNLIFAPHMNLFNKDSRHGLPYDSIPQKYKEADNMIIDFGSVHSVDMTYTSNADIYLGDVSSQIYEFLLDRPKPAIFIDAHHITENENSFYKHFSLGKVIENIENLDELLKNRENWQKEYAEKQRKAIAYTFDIDPNISSSKRVADAIKDLIKS